MKLCVFQGTFNPIHNAHLRIANHVADNYDKILWIPAYNPPHKDCDKDLSVHRLNMVKLATEEYEKYEVSDIEYKRGGKSYTYLTICELYEKYEIDGKINFIIGTDSFKNIKSWYETDKLKELVKFIVFKREDNIENSVYDVLRQDGYNFEFQTLSFKNISSTELRNKIKNRENVDDYLPKNVEEYIKINELYKS